MKLSNKRLLRGLLIYVCLEQVLETNLRQTSNDVLPRLHNGKSIHLPDASYETRQALNFLPSDNRKTTNTHFTTYHCLCSSHTYTWIINSVFWYVSKENIESNNYQAARTYSFSKRTHLTDTLSALPMKKVPMKRQKHYLNVLLSYWIVKHETNIENFLTRKSWWLKSNLLNHIQNIQFFSAKLT